MLHRLFYSRKILTSLLEDDAVAYFTSVFSQPNARLQGLPTHLAAVTGSPCSELFSYFSAANVKTHIIRYPKSVSCGADSMHARILEALLPSGIDIVLSLLFQICVMTGSTPARWNTSIVCPIPKKSSSVHIDAFCPIVLTEMF
ncbi:hypothetical protein DSO57_1037241 [Entomophthora muscae]|uniref:Uncharacterized protein n=1 Tax=Entomophthora muscae TaxID=34485 RepID=A0ACC2SCG4_9FUNG|nr:hypothetical protein DSO57_1037241 [Entomophthora muscae]